MTTSTDLFAGLDVTAEPTAVTETETVDATENSTDAEQTESVDSTPDAPVETVTSVPEDAVSVTDFAKHISQYLMRQVFEQGAEMDGTEYVSAQTVYQTVKAQKDRIPHVLVREADETESRVYILKTQATDWWLARRERLASRGAGSTSPSNRTAEQNLTLLGAAVNKHLYAQARLALWTANTAQAEKLIEKYKGFLKDADSATIELAIQEATDAFNAEQAAKAAEKAAKKAKDIAATFDADADADAVA